MKRSILLILCTIIAILLCRNYILCRNYNTLQNDYTLLQNDYNAERTEREYLEQEIEDYAEFSADITITAEDTDTKAKAEQYEACMTAYAEKTEEYIDWIKHMTDAEFLDYLDYLDENENL